MAEIGKYEVIKTLGKGATSVVYLAYDPFADREVAIKYLNLEGMETAEGNRFKRLFMTEASLAGKLEHPYIASIYDAVITEDVNYLVMEYVGGGTLERYCQVDNLLPVEKVIEIVFKCCRALNYACGNGIIHCDIKPENILIVDGTDIKISDFGAAVVKLDDSGEVSQSAGAGSLAFMSPEQIQGLELNLQTDIYSLGVMFYKMLTGFLPFSAPNDASMAFQILHVEPPQPSTYRMDIPGMIDEIVMKTLAKNLQDRFQNWEDFEQTLVSVFENLPRSTSFPDTDKFNILRKMDFFSEFGEIELWEVLRISKWAFYPEGTSIIREGDETSSIFIIVSGEAEIRKNGMGICTLNSGECFGEISGIRKTARRRTASVFAYRDIKLIEISERLLHQSSETCQRLFDKAFLVILANRLSVAGTRNRPGEGARDRPPAGAASPNQPDAVTTQDKRTLKMKSHSESNSLVAVEERLGRTLGKLKLTMIALVVLVIFVLLLNLALLFK